MPSAWTDHVKLYQQEHGCTYKEALQEAGESYQRKPKPQKKKRVATPERDPEPVVRRAPPVKKARKPSPKDTVPAHEPIGDDRRMEEHSEHDVVVPGKKKNVRKH